MQRTKNGRHIFFAWQGGLELRNTAKRLPEIDTRANGGYIVASPSEHPDGGCYEWLIPLTEPLAVAPEALLNALKPEPIKTLHLRPVLK